MVWFDPKTNKDSHDPFMNRNEFEKEYLNEFSSPKFLNWLDDFCNQLDCPPPEPFDGIEYFKRVGAWETQNLILRKLRYAIKMEREISNKNE